MRERERERERESTLLKEETVVSLVVRVHERVSE